MTTITSRPFNNDNTPHFAAFQARFQESRQSAYDASAAVKLHSTPPNPTQLSEHEASEAVKAVHGIPQSMGTNEVHNTLDPDRVKRLLGLLD